MKRFTYSWFRILDSNSGYPLLTKSATRQAEVEIDSAEASWKFLGSDMGFKNDGHQNVLETLLIR